MLDPLETLLRAQQLQDNIRAKDDFSEIDPNITRDLRSDVLDENGRMRILPASFWASTTVPERGMFGALTGIYSYPTVKLVDRLTELIGGRSAIEIGAGNGVLAQELGIPATDNRMQEKDPYKAMYALNRAKTVPYGDHVVEMHASRAVRHFKPQVVIGCWVTHKYDPARHEAGGNEIGIDEEDILRNCEAYIVVGQERAHAGKKIWTRKHTIEYPEFVFSRAMKEGRDFIAVWPGLKKPKTKE